MRRLAGWKIKDLEFQKNENAYNIAYGLKSDFAYRSEVGGEPKLWTLFRFVHDGVRSELCGRVSDAVFINGSIWPKAYV